jgi:hypothetical protein
MDIEAVAGVEADRLHHLERRTLREHVCRTVLGAPLAAAISSTARRRLPPMLGGASKSTTPSRVVRKADWRMPSVTQYRFPVPASSPRW